MGYGQTSGFGFNRPMSHMGPTNQALAQGLAQPFDSGIYKQPFAPIPFEGGMPNTYKKPGYRITPKAI